VNQDQRLITDYQPLVRAIAAKYRQKGVETDDLIQDGMVGLLEALKRYDAEKGAQFSTYSSYWVEKKMRESLAGCWRDAGRNIADPGSVEAGTAQAPSPRVESDPVRLEVLDSVEARVISLDFEEGNTLAEIGEILGISRSRVKQIKKKAIRKMRNSPPDGGRK
jgi:DNA-directed RNA polymerase specialized sigma subunit